MAAGKSTAGRLLAARIGYAFADTDEEISKETEMSVPQFIEDHGFESFRKMERKILRRLAANGRTVISCGGGLYPTSATADIFSKGISIFIEVPEEILAKRILGNLPAYPKFAKFSSKQEIRKEISSLLLRRIKFYEKCDLQYSPGNASLEQAAGEIAEKIYLYYNSDE